MSKDKITKDTEFIEDDTSLDDDPIVLPDGHVLDEAGAEEYGRQVADRAAARRAGRPSLTAPGVHSPQLSSRVSPELKAQVDAVAERDGVRTSEVVRTALEEYVKAHA